MSDIFPVDFQYDESTRTLDVEWPDGSVVRYPETDPRLGFLVVGNPRWVRDFLDYLEFEWAPSFPKGDLVKAKRRVPVKQDIIREADSENAPGEPQTRPLLVHQQSRSDAVQTRLTYPNTGNRT